MCNAVQETGMTVVFYCSWSYLCIPGSVTSAVCGTNALILYQSSVLCVLSPSQLNRNSELKTYSTLMLSRCLKFAFTAVCLYINNVLYCISCSSNKLYRCTSTVYHAVQNTGRTSPYGTNRITDLPSKSTYTTT